MSHSEFDRAAGMAHMVRVAVEEITRKKFWELCPLLKSGWAPSKKVITFNES